MTDMYDQVIKGSLVNAVKIVKSCLADATVTNPLRELVMRDIFTVYAKADLQNVREDNDMITNELIYNVSYKPTQTADIDIDWSAMKVAANNDNDSDDSNDGNIPDNRDFELLESHMEKKTVVDTDVSTRSNLPDLVPSDTQKIIFSQVGIGFIDRYFQICTISEGRTTIEAILLGLLKKHLEHYKIEDTDAAQHACIEAAAVDGRCVIEFKGDVQFTDDDASDASETDADTVKPAATDIATTKPDFTQAFKDAFEESELDPPKNWDVSKYTMDNCKYNCIQN